MQYWFSIQGKIEHINFFKGIDYGFNGFDKPLSKKLIEFCLLLSFSFCLFSPMEIPGL